MRWFSLSWLFVVVSSTSVLAQDSYKIEPMKKAPPAALAADLRAVLSEEGFRVLNGAGKTHAEFWLRKNTPASEKPSGPKGAVQYPFLTAGELLGALEYFEEGHDYRDQSIAKGVYTVRYGLQPVNGDHLGVSVFRDYVLLLPSSKDTTLEVLAKKPLEERSAESAGTSHPAVFLLVAPPANTKAPAIVRDEEKDTWGAVVPLQLQIKGTQGTTPIDVQVIIAGVSMA